MVVNNIYHISEIREYSPSLGLTRQQAEPRRRRRRRRDEEEEEQENTDQHPPASDHLDITA